MKYTTHIFSNNLQTIFIDTDSFPSFTALLLINVGSRDEKPKLGGISHFIEHMTFKGSQKYPTAYDISSTIEGVGGVINAYTSKDHTGYWVKAPIHHANTVIDVMGDMVLRPKLVKEEIAREKNVIIEEINMYEDMPSRKVSDFFDETIFHGSSLARDIAGTPHTVSAFTQAQIKKYIHTHYHPDKSILVISGGIEKYIESLKDKIEDTFLSWQNGTGYNRKYGRRVERHIKLKQSKARMHIHTKDTEQSHVCLGFRAFPYNDPKRYALTVLSAILGGGMSSRLFIKIRERLGLCYYISTGRELYQDTGYIVTQAGVKNDAHTMEQALKAIYQEHVSLTKKLSDQELHRAKELLKGRLILSLEDSHSMASFIAGQMRMTGTYHKPQEVIERIDAVTPEHITNLAQQLFIPKNMTIAAIGPVSKKGILIDNVIS